MLLSKISEEVLFCDSILAQDEAFIQTFLHQSQNLSYGQSLALRNACLMENYPLIQQLIQNGIEIDENLIYSSIYYATSKKNLEIVQYLLQQAKFSKIAIISAINEAIAQNKIPLMEILTHKQKFSNLEKDNFLSLASGKGFIDMFKALYTDLKVSKLSNIAIFHALQHNQTEMAIYLFSQGCEFEVTNKFVMKQIFKNNALDSLKLLMQRGFDLEKYRDLKDVKNLSDNPSIHAFIQENIPDLKLKAVRPKGSLSARFLPQVKEREEKQVQDLREAIKNSNLDIIREILSIHKTDIILKDPLKRLLSQYPSEFQSFLETFSEILKNNVGTLFEIVVNSRGVDVTSHIQYLIHHTQNNLELINQALRVSLQNPNEQVADLLLKAGGSLKNPHEFLDLIHSKSEYTIAKAVEELWNKDLLPRIFDKSDPSLDALLQILKSHDLSLLTDELLQSWLKNNNNRNFLLYFAIAAGNLEYVKRILENCSKKFIFREECLDECIFLNQPEILDYLLGLEQIQEAYSQLEESILIEAIEEINLACVKVALNHGADVNINMDDNENDPIHTAIFSNNLEILALVLDASKDCEIEPLIRSAVNDKFYDAIPLILARFNKPPNDNGILLSELMSQNLVEPALQLIDYGENWQFLQKREYKTQIKIYFESLPSDHYRYPLKSYILKDLLE